MKKTSKSEDRSEDKSKMQNIKDLLKEYNVPEENVTIRAVLDKMQERLEMYIKVIMQILQPEEYHSLHECTVFDDPSKTKIFDMYKDMMILHREILKSVIKNDEKDMAATIKFTHSELKKFKPEMIDIVTKMQDSWKITGTNGRIRYFG